MCVGVHVHFKHVEIGSHVFWGMYAFQTPVEIGSHVFRGIFAFPTCRDRITFVSGNICRSDM